MNKIVIDTVKELVSQYSTSDPYEIAEQLEIAIRYVQTDDEFTGVYIPIDDKKLIVLNESLKNKLEAHFPLSHEIWHAIHHSDVVAYYHDGINVKGKFEREANQFATYLCLIDKEINMDNTAFEVLRENYIPEEMAEFLLE